MSSKYMQVKIKGWIYFIRAILYIYTINAAFFVIYYTYDVRIYHYFRFKSFIMQFYN